MQLSAPHQQLIALLLLPLLTHANHHHLPIPHHHRAAIPHPTDTTSYSTTYLTTPSTAYTTLPAATNGVPDISVQVDAQVVTGWDYPCDGSCTWEPQVPTSTTGSLHTWWKTRDGTSWVSVPTAPPSAAVFVGESVSTGKPYVGHDEGKGKGEGAGKVHCDASGHCSEG